MSTRKNILTACFAAVLASGLAACGGGGTKVENTAPSLTLGGAAAIDEGATGTTGLTVTATDGQGDTITYQVSDARFDVVGGMLVVVAGAMLDYEMESSVAVDITASDGALSETMTANVMVNNVDDVAPTLSTHGTRGNITEGDTGGTGITFMADDNDMLGNLMFSTDVAGFDVISLGGGRYELVVTQALDREMMAQVQVVVTVEDDTGSVMTPTLTIAVGGVDDTAPMLGMTGTGGIDENEEGDTSVYFRPTDADGDAMFTFYVEGDNRTHFQVVPAGFNVYALQVSDAFDYEMTDDGMVSVTVTVADSAGMSDSATFNVTVNDLNDNAPMVTTTGSAAINEEQMGSTGLMVGVTDADTVGDATTWTVDDSRFSIDADGYLVLNEALDYDGAMGVMSVTVNVTANDGANDSMAEEITVTINAVNDNTPMISVDAAGQMDQMEGTFAAATSTGVTVSVTDGDGDMVTPMVTGDARFAIDAMGNLVIAAGSMFDYEEMADQSIELTITATDDGGLAAESQTVTVMFTDVNDSAPMLTVTDNQGGPAVKVVTRDEGEVSANTPTNHKVVVSDEDTHDLPTAMVSDSRFMIDENGYLTIVAGSVFNFEDAADKSIALEITANDGANAEASYTITFNIANVDEPPMIDGERSPTLVMGPYGDGNKDVTTLTAVDPDNPDDPFIVRWSTRTNPDDTVWTWTENRDGDKYTLGMKAGTFLGRGGPAAQVAADSAATPPVDAVGYTGYTADDAETLRRHVVDVDDAELDERAIVVVTQTVDTVETSSALAMYGTYSVDPSKAHIDNATVAERAAGTPGQEMFIPNFDELTNVNTASDTDDGVTTARLLTDQEIHNGISTANNRLGGTNYTKAAAQSNALTTAGVTVPPTAADGTHTAAAYNTAMVSPSISVPMEPMGLDIVTDTRAVDIESGATKAGQELAIRYRFTTAAGVAADTGATPPENPNYNVDVALVDNSGMVLEEYRNAAAYSTTAADATITASTSPIEVDVSTTSGSDSAGATPDNTLDYAKYGLWSYNNLRMCSTCPQGSDGSAGGGLRGATAFGLKARPGDLDTQDHVGLWQGTTVAFWGSEDDGSIDPASLTVPTAGSAAIAVNFKNSKVQANMAIGTAHTFSFHGMLDTGRLGYTASIDTTIPGGAGSITGNGDLDADGTTDLAVDGQDNVHARGMLNGTFYGPTAAPSGSTVANAKASAETAGTWQITDVPDINANDAKTTVIGAFGADLTGNMRATDTAVDAFSYIDDDE